MASPESGIRWIFSIERGLTVDADREQMLRVLINLARNAVQALESRAPNEPSRDQIRITGRREGAVVVLELADTGPGLSEKARAASVRGIPGLDARRRHRPWPHHRGRTRALAWRRDQAGGRHDRCDIPHHHSRPRRRSAGMAQRTGARLTLSPLMAELVAKSGVHAALRQRVRRMQCYDVTADTAN